MATPIVFFGNERLATGVTSSTPILQQLLGSDYDIKAVVVHNEPTLSRKLRTQEVVMLAEQNHIPVLAPHTLQEVAITLKSYQAAVGVLAAFGKIVPQSIIDIFPAGIVNIHPSLLPLHRGPTPIESVILDGSHVTGVSLMRLVKEMDAGPVYAYSEYRLDGMESKQVLADNLGSLGASMLEALLPGIIAGDIVGKPQNENEATYDRLITKKDGQLDWHKPAIELERQIRAFAEWPKSHASLNGIDVIITAAHVESGDGPPGVLNAKPTTGTLQVYCGKDSLCIERLKPSGKSEITAQEFLRGYGQHLNL